MNIFVEMEKTIRAALEAVLGDGIDPALLARAVVEPPRDPAHGDMATNAAMVLAREAGMTPRDLAVRLAEIIRLDTKISHVEIAGPGFINMRLSHAALHDVLRAVLTGTDSYGRTDIGHGERVNVEYVSANPTGPLHVAHVRGAVFGDALASILAFTGHDVCREYYINDAGSQVDTLARSALLRYREALGEDIGSIPEGMYPGEYLCATGQQLRAEFGDALLRMAEGERMAIVRERAVASMMALVRDDLKRLGIHHDVFFSEKTLHGEGGAIDRVMRHLRARGLVYEGRLDPPKGKEPEDWEDREQTLFRASDFGDDTDRPLVKANGSWTYFAADIAYHLDKYERGARNMVLVVGADHGGYGRRMEAAVRAVSDGNAAVDVKFCQIVRLFRGGQPVKMSKRSGDMVTLRELIDEVGPDAVRFLMLMRRNEAALDFDYEKALEQSRDNPVFYVQYAHARACSVLRMAAEEGLAPPTDPAGADLSSLIHAADLKLMRMLAEFPRTVYLAATHHEPHRLAFWLVELAAEFHTMWNLGKEVPQLRFINRECAEISTQRLLLVAAVRDVVAKGLGLLGVASPREML